MLRSGRLNRRVNIEAQTKTIDTNSPPWRDGNSESWTTVRSNVPAGIEPIRGAELFDANQVQSETTVRVLIRYHSYKTLTAANRLTHVVDGVTKILNIEQIIQPNTNRGHFELMCSEGMNLG